MFKSETIHNNNSFILCEIFRMTIKDFKYKKVKCPNCGTKTIASHEKRSYCSSCGSELFIKLGGTKYMCKNCRVIFKDRKDNPFKSCPMCGSIKITKARGGLVPRIGPIQPIVPVLLKSSSSKMSNIHVPLDYSNLKAIIPPGEDIIYSTLCVASDSSIPFGGTTKWISHILLTNKGLAYTKPRIKKTLKAFYTDWNNVKNVFKGGITLSLTGFVLKLAKEPNESNQGFIIRKNRFQSIIKPVIEKRKKEWELKVPNKIDRKKITKNRKFEMDL